MSQELHQGQSAYPDARAGETHRVAETVDRGVSDLELTGGSGVD